MALTVEAVAAEDTYALRHRALGRGRTPADIAAADDAEPESAHFAVRLERAVVATGTVRRRRSPRGGPGAQWQVRGMAVEPELRGRGFGAAILSAIIDHVEERGGGVVWCHARIAARSLYERHGFVPQGEPFDDAVAGTQVFMSRPIP